jgi:Trypsin-like peptidase domain
VAIDKISLATTPVIRYDGDRPLSRATGFLFGFPAETTGFCLALVTNYHVLTGSAPRRRLAAKGDRIDFEIRRAGESAGKVQPVRFPLRTLDDTPTFAVCASFPEADLAIVPLPIDDRLFEQPPTAFDRGMIDLDVATYPGQTVSVVGYPLGWKDRANKLPVWKTGHIASEPEIDFDGDPRFLIDITGRPGMSGSPVIGGHMEMYLPSKGIPRFGSSGRLLGVYASNAIRSPTAAGPTEEVSLEEATEEGRTDWLPRPELGFVWKARLIGDTLASLNLPDWRSKVWARLPGSGGRQ